MVNQPITCTIPRNEIENNPFNEDWYNTYFNEDYWNFVNYSCSSIEVTDNELMFIKSILKESKSLSILDLFCGIGRHANRLSEEGYTVTGVDINQETIEMAKNSGVSNVNYIVDDARKFVSQNKYDCCLLMQTSFGYFSEFENRELISRINSLLNDNGILIIDVPNRDNMLKNFRYRDWITINDATYCLTHQFDYIAGRRNTIMKVIDDNGERENSHSIRMYTISEMIEILESNGFSVEKLYGDFTINNIRFNNNFRRLQLVAQKK